MEYLIRFVQTHESFRQPEINALATLTGVNIEWLSYSENSPFAIIRFKDSSNTEQAAKSLISRSILSSAIYELWGSGVDYAALHKDVHERSHHLWERCHLSSFRFEIDGFQGKHSSTRLRDIVETFAYTGFEGPIDMTKPDNQFVIFEAYTLHALIPNQVHLGRLVAGSGRRAVEKYSLKKRSYIATTSMDAELSLVTANLALIAPGKVAYDPFMGTGSFPVSCAHFGASVCGSDLDGRTIRGKNGRNVQGNFKQYDTLSQYLGGFVADLTNTPLRSARLLDAIVCDPPYGVREGLKVLGSARHAPQEEVFLQNGMPAHLAENYVPPRKPYSFVRMMNDILDFSATRLVEGGRLCMWMPIAGAVADEEMQEEIPEDISDYEIPQHPALVVVVECTQHFNKWSRRLLTYQRIPDHDINQEVLLTYHAARVELENRMSCTPRGTTANDLNSFRKKYFQGFIDPKLPRTHEKLPHTY